MESRESYFQDRKSREQKTPLWKGWLFDGSRIIDKSGNVYTRRDIELSFYAGQIVDGFQSEGTAVIHSIKKEIERRRDLLKLPKVCIIYETSQGTIEKVFNLSEIV